MNVMCLRNYNCTIGSIVNKYRHKTICNDNTIWTREYRHGTSTAEAADVNFHSFAAQKRVYNVYNNRLMYEMLHFICQDRYWKWKKNTHTENWTNKTSFIALVLMPLLLCASVFCLARYCLVFWFRLRFAGFHHWISIYVCSKHRLHLIYSIMKILHVLRFTCNVYENFVVIDTHRHTHILHHIPITDFLS